MVKNEYKRLLLSWITVIFLAAQTALTVVNYYFSLLQKAEYVSIYNGGSQADLNMEALQELISSYNGFRFFFDYYNGSDESNIGIILAFAWLGIFITASACRHRESGYGCYFVTRCGYKSYCKSLLAAQSLYIATCWGILFILQLISAFIVGRENGAGYRIYNAPQCLGIIFCLCLIYAFYFICINAIVSGFIFFVRGKYIIQAAPLLIFVILPILVIGILPSIIGNFADLIPLLINPFSYLTELTYLIRVFYFSDLVNLFISMCCYLLCAAALTGISMKKLNRNYI